MPIGAARLAEPHPGCRPRPPGARDGFAAIVLLPLAVLAPSARCVARAAPRHGGTGSRGPGRRDRPGSRAGAPRRARSPAAPATGWRSSPATAGPRCRSAARWRAARSRSPRSPPRPFSAPVSSGWSAARAVRAELGAGAELGLRRHPRLPRRADRRRRTVVSGYAPATSGSSTAGRGDRARGRRRPCPRRSGGYLTMLAGRGAAPDEIALGAQTCARSARASARPSGDGHLVGGVRATSTVMRIAGARRPPHSAGRAPTTGLGTGAVLSPSLLSRDPATPAARRRATCYIPPAHVPAGHRSRRTAAMSPAAQAGCPYGPCTIAADQRPGDIKNYASIRDTPLALAAVLGVLAVGTLAHVLLTGVRRRRRDLAVLKTLGFTRWEVRGTVAGRPAPSPPPRSSPGCRSASSRAGGLGAVRRRRRGPRQATVRAARAARHPPATLLAANLIAAGPAGRPPGCAPPLVLRTE